VLFTVPLPSRLPPVERTLRLTTGLILFSFAATHFLNHACGILRLNTMEEVRGVLLWPWRTYVGQFLLYGSFLTHGSLGLVALYRRRHFRIPANEFWQLLLGLSIPPLVIIHATNVRLGHFLFGLDDNYPRLVYQYWIAAPNPGLLRQFALLLVVWTHACIGLRSWLRSKSWYQKWLPVMAAVVTLIPVLAVVGIADAGMNTADLAASDPSLFKNYDPRGKPQSASLVRIGDGLIVTYLGLLGAVLVLRAGREWRERRHHGITIKYPRGRTVLVPRGFSILEASRWAGIDHVSICGGRGRCSTCRVLVTSGRESLASPGAAELLTLERIGAQEGVRLACQVRPNHNVEVIPLLPAPGNGAMRGRTVISAAQERDIVAIFIDLRNSTRLADGRLPYDTLYVIDRYVTAVTHAVEQNGGQVTSVAGDGVMCCFGADCDTPTACRRALLALRALWVSLDELSEKFTAEFDYPLRFGAGCHLGLAVIGELASRHTTQFLGEVGNIAARLEGLTKSLGCTIIVSRSVVERAGLEMPKIETHRVEIRNVTAEIEMIAIRSPQELDDLILAHVS
jgi:adenylate cyclase